MTDLECNGKYGSCLCSSLNSAGADSPLAFPVALGWHFVVAHLPGRPRPPDGEVESVPPPLEPGRTGLFWPREYSRSGRASAPDLTFWGSGSFCPRALRPLSCHVKNSGWRQKLPGEAGRCQAPYRVTWGNHSSCVFWGPGPGLSGSKTAWETPNDSTQFNLVSPQVPGDNSQLYFKPLNFGVICYIDVENRKNVSSQIQV